MREVVFEILIKMIVGREMVVRGFCFKDIGEVIVEGGWVGVGGEVKVEDVCELGRKCGNDIRVGLVNMWVVVREVRGVREVEGELLLGWIEWKGG